MKDPHHQPSIMPGHRMVGHLAVAQFGSSGRLTLWWRLYGDGSKPCTLVNMKIAGIYGC